jgi:hypothetical protein
LGLLLLLSSSSYDSAQSAEKQFAGPCHLPTNCAGLAIEKSIKNIDPDNGNEEILI